MKNMFGHIVRDYGMLFVLLLLCAVFSVATIRTVHPTGAAAGRQVAQDILDSFPANVKVMIATRGNDEDVAFAEALDQTLKEANVTVVARVSGQSFDIVPVLEKLNSASQTLDVIACTQQTLANSRFLSELGKRFENLKSSRVLTQRSYYESTFFSADNLLNNVIPSAAIYAIIAIGMTMVIITGGIDLSVGSLIALSAVVAGIILRDVFGGFSAGIAGMTAACLAAIAVGGLLGLFSGSIVTAFGITPFVVTLAMMSMARGLAFILSNNTSINEIPATFKQFSIGRPLGVPNLVVIMVVLYIMAHIIMTRTVLGRYVYAVGGNREAARLSGVPVKRVLLFVYALCGALAGLGGALEAAKLSSASPLYGREYELFVIAAVVVGGTSLMGGEGKILNSLIGALIIAVIQKGLNLLGVDSNRQLVVMGALIVGAVLIDNMKKRGFFNLARLRRR